MVWQATTGAVSRRAAGDMDFAVQDLYRNGEPKCHFQSLPAYSPANEPEASLSCLQRANLPQGPILNDVPHITVRYNLLATNVNESATVV